MFIDPLVPHASAPSQLVNLRQAGGFLLIPGGTSSVVILIAGIFLVLVVPLALLGFTLLHRRVGALAAQVSARETATTRQGAELEAQALLVRQMSMDLEELRTRLMETGESRQSPAPLWAAAEMPVNLNRRGQIIRLSRKGKSVPEIASDLHIAQGEVELLLKVHDLGQRSGLEESPRR